MTITGIKLKLLPKKKSTFKVIREIDIEELFKSKVNFRKVQIIRKGPPADLFEGKHIYYKIKLITTKNIIKEGSIILSRASKYKKGFGRLEGGIKLIICLGYLKKTGSILLIKTPLHETMLFDLFEFIEKSPFNRILTQLRKYKS